MLVSVGVVASAGGLVVTELQAARRRLSLVFPELGDYFTKGAFI